MVINLSAVILRLGTPSMINDGLTFGPDFLTRGSSLRQDWYNHV